MPYDVKYHLEEENTLAGHEGNETASRHTEIQSYSTENEEQQYDFQSEEESNQESQPSQGASEISNIDAPTTSCRTYSRKRKYIDEESADDVLNRTKKTLEAMHEYLAVTRALLGQIKIILQGQNRILTALENIACVPNIPN